MVPRRGPLSRSCEKPLEACKEKAVPMHWAIDVSESKCHMGKHGKQCHPGYRLRSSQPRALGAAPRVSGLPWLKWIAPRLLRCCEINHLFQRRMIAMTLERYLGGGDMRFGASGYTILDNSVLISFAV